MVQQSARLFLVISASLLVTSCATLKNGRGWGQDVTLTPGWRRIGDSAKDALQNPKVWGPVLGAVILQIDRMDKKVSNWAVQHTPVFGSQAHAHHASSTLITVSNIAYWMSVLATPSGEHPKEWLVSKSKGVAVGVTANQLTFHLTRVLQRTTERERPNEDSDFTSFPSLHTSYAASQIMLASKNIDHCLLSRPLKFGVRLGFETITVGMAWARVEAQQHYPSDVLAGMALGYFVSAFFNDAFLGVDRSEDITLTIEPTTESAVVRMYWAF